MNEIPQQLLNNNFAFLKENSKNPTAESWKENQLIGTNEKLSSWNGNLAFVCGSNNVRVIDIEGVEKGNIFFNELTKSLNDLDTFKVQTPSGGYHYYIKNSDTYEQAYFNITIKGIHAGEFRARDCYVVAPGSVVNEKTYTIVNDVQIKEIPLNKIRELLNITSKIEPTPQQIEAASDETRSGKEYAEVCRLQSKALKEKNQILTFAEINKEMQPFSKWVSASHQYRELTYKKATEFIQKNPIKQETKKELIELKEVPSLILICFDEEFKPIFKDTYKHLQFFKLIDAEIGLQGEEYFAVKKAAYYYAESLRQAPCCYNIGNESLDNRIHFGAMIAPGKGKGKIKSIAKSSNAYYELNGNRVNLEQLIGKILKNKKTGVETPNLGYFYGDALVFDEAQTLLNEEDKNLAGIMAESRKAMDTYTKNIPDKKLVDNLTSLREPPTFRGLFLIHPVNFSPVFFDLGTFRRMFFFHVKPTKITKEETNKNYYSESRNNEIATFFSEKIPTTGINMNKEQIDSVFEYIDALRSFLLNNSNKRARTLGLMWHFSFPQNFFKMVSVLAISRYEKTPSIKTINEACFDCCQLLLETIQTYGNNSSLNLSRSIWKTTDSDIALFLEWLYFNGATSKEKSKVSISSALDQIRWVNTERQARNIIYKLKNVDGLIDSAQTESHDSRIWLTFEPDLGGSVDLKDYPPIDFKAFLEEKRDNYMGGKEGKTSTNINNNEVGGKEGNDNPPLYMRKSENNLSSSFVYNEKLNTPPEVSTLSTLEPEVCSVCKFEPGVELVAFGQVQRWVGLNCLPEVKVAQAKMIEAKKEAGL